MAPASEAANPVLTIQGLGGTGTDVTAFVDKVEVIRASDGTVVSGAAGNLGFETYGALGNGDSDYGPVLGAVTPVDGGASLLLAGGSAPAAPAPRQIAACRSSSFCPRCFVVAGAFFLGTVIRSQRDRGTSSLPAPDWFRTRLGALPPALRRKRVAGFTENSG